MTNVRGYHKSAIRTRQKVELGITSINVVNRSGNIERFVIVRWGQIDLDQGALIPAGRANPWQKS